MATTRKERQTYIIETSIPHRQRYTIQATSKLQAHKTFKATPEHAQLLDYYINYGEEKVEDVQGPYANPKAAFATQEPKQRPTPSRSTTK